MTRFWQGHEHVSKVTHGLHFLKSNLSYGLHAIFDRHRHQCIGYVYDVCMYARYTRVLSHLSTSVQSDQFGVAHAPFANGRALLSEHGFGHVDVIVTREDGSFAVVRATDLAPAPPIFGECELCTKQQAKGVQSAAV